MTLAQLFGFGVVGPVYFGLHYVASQIANFKASDHRLTDLAYTRTILPVLVVAFYVPLYLGYYAPSFNTRYAGLFIWQLFPVWISLSQLLLAKTVMPSTMQYDRLHAPKQDILTIRYTVGFTIALASLVWIYTVTRSPFSLLQILEPEWTNSQTSWTDCVRNVLQYDYAFVWTSCFLWLGYLYMDLKHAGMVKESWMRIVTTTVLTTVVLGPGATAGLAWLWREEILATRRHKDAVITAGPVLVTSDEKH